jgi:hypothetical protein
MEPLFTGPVAVVVGRMVVVLALVMVALAAAAVEVVIPEALEPAAVRH